MNYFKLHVFCEPWGLTRDATKKHRNGPIYKWLLETKKGDVKKKDDVKKKKITTAAIEFLSIVSGDFQLTRDRLNKKKYSMTIFFFKPKEVLNEIIFQHFSNFHLYSSPKNWR